MKVYEAMANAFIKEGTTTLFGLLGDGQMTWWSEIAKQANLKIVDVRDEGCAVTMAEGSQVPVRGRERRGLAARTARRPQPASRLQDAFEHRVRVECNSDFPIS